MYLIIVYDVGNPRGNKVKSFLRTYLFWIQNSVFEGEVTEKEFIEIKESLNRIIDKSYDSIIIFKLRNMEVMKREVVGIEKAPMSIIL